MGNEQANTKDLCGAVSLNGRQMGRAGGRRRSRAAGKPTVG